MYTAKFPTKATTKQKNILFISPYFVYLQPEGVILKEKKTMQTQKSIKLISLLDVYRNESWHTYIWTAQIEFRLKSVCVTAMSLLLFEHVDTHNSFTHTHTHTSSLIFIGLHSMAIFHTSIRLFRLSFTRGSLCFRFNMRLYNVLLIQSIEGANTRTNKRNPTLRSTERITEKKNTNVTLLVAR